MCALTPAAHTTCPAASYMCSGSGCNLSPKGIVGSDHLTRGTGRRVLGGDCKGWLAWTGAVLSLGRICLTVLPDISVLALLPCSKIASLSRNKVCLHHHAQVVPQGCAPRAACLGMAVGKELACPGVDTTALTLAATRAEIWLQST